MPVSPDAGEAFARALVEVYADVEREMIAAIARRLDRGLDAPSWYDDKLAQATAVRRELERTLVGLPARAEETIRDSLDAAYRAGIEAASIDIRDAGLEAAFSGIRGGAVEEFVAEALDRVVATHPGILRQTFDVYREVVTEVGPGIPSGALTRREATSRALARFADRGVSGFTDAAGRRWQLDSYSEMVMRTSSGRAHVAGGLRRFDDLGQEGDLVVVSDSPEECPLCRPYEGAVLSRSGRSREYGSLQAAISNGLFHPNCTHSLGLFVPGLTRPMKNTENPRGYEERQKQRYLERNVRKWKRREVAALDPKDRTYAKNKRKDWTRRLENHVETHNRKRLRYRESIVRPKRGASGPSPSDKIVSRSR